MILRRVMLAVSRPEIVPIYVLDRVGRLARAFGAHVDLFHCLYEPQAVRTGAGKLIAARVRERRLRLERLADILRSQAVAVSAGVRWDFPLHEAVIRQVLRHKSDLLIVPAIGLGEASRTRMYRERRLIEQTPCAVLFMKTRQSDSNGCIVAAVDPPEARDEYGDLDEIAIGAAKTLASALADVPVHLYHAEAAGADGRTSARVSATEAEVRHLAELHEVPAGHVRVELGEPRDSLPAYLREARAQTLVIGVRSGPDRARARNERLAEQLVDPLECDLLVVKARYEHPAVGMKPAPTALPRSL